MNWLWVIAGAFIGSVVLSRGLDGMLIGAALGALFSMLVRSNSQHRALERRVQMLEQGLHEQAQARTGSAEVPAEVSAASLEPVMEQATLVQEPAMQSIEQSEPEPALPSSPVASGKPIRDPDWQQTSNVWLDRLFGGNLLAKAGVVLLFFGAASALKLAADYGLFPPPVRLLLAALAGAALVGFGHNRARLGDKQAFGFALQGGGFAILYLSIYFAFSRYDFIGAVPAFAGFALLGVGCALLAVRQNSQALAWLGLAGAFFAPALASTGGNQYQVLFGHFLLLDVFIVAISSLTAWRSLNLLGFFFTTLFGALWAFDGYEPAFRSTMEIFLLLFFLLYTLAPALLAYYRKPAASAWLDGALLFGVPAVAAVVQGAMGYERDYLAMTAFGAAVYYLGLAWLTRQRESKSMHYAFAALSLTCLTISIPLAFGAGVTTVFWALEGAAVLSFGLMQQRRLAIHIGKAIQLLAALRLILDGGFMELAVPWWNDFLPGALALALAGAFSAWQLHRHDRNTFSQAAALLWTLAWWLLAGGNEIWLQAAPENAPGLTLLWAGLAALALELSGTRLNWPGARYAAGVLWPAALIAMLVSIERTGHVLAGALALALPLVLALAGWILHRQQHVGLTAWLKARHLGFYWLSLLALAVESGWRAEQLLPAVPLWAPVAILAVLGAGLALPRWLEKQQRWPVSGLESLYRFEASVPLAAGLSIGLILLNFNFNGVWNLAYVPVLNPLDFISLLALYNLWRFGATPEWKRLTGHDASASVGVLALLWLTAVWARIAHHYLGVPYSFHALEQSALFQAGVSLLWTASAIAAMVISSRLKVRPPWFAGIGLLALVGLKLLLVDLGQASLAIRTATLLGMGALILIAGYFAPVPPRQDSTVNANEHA